MAGMPMTTASWFVLGLVLFIAGWAAGWLAPTLERALLWGAGLYVVLGIYVFYFYGIG